MNKKVFDIIEKISKEHCKKTFGYLGEDDLRNEIWQICLEKLEDFDKNNGELEHWLRVVVKNRLVNRFKDITKSVRSPCPRCPFFDLGGSPGDCSKYGEKKDDCKKWRNYQLSICSRNSLLNATESQDNRTTPGIGLDKIITEEVKRKIESKLSQEFTNDFNKLISGEKISKSKLKKLKIEISAILKE